MTGAARRDRFQVIGYPDRLSVGPGESISFMTSAEAAWYDLHFVRLVDGVFQPLNSRSEIPVPTPVDGRYEGKHQTIATGSCLRVPDEPVLRLDGSFTLLAWIRPATPAAGRSQGVLTKRFVDEHGGYGLGLSADGDLCLRIDPVAGTTTELRMGTPMRPAEWYLVACVYDAPAGRVVLTQRPVSRWLRAESVCIDDVHVTPRANAAPLLVAADGSSARSAEISGFYNGKIEAPQIWSRALSHTQVADLEGGADPRGLGPGLVAAWAFYEAPASSTVRDVGPHDLDAEAMNGPARGMTGHRWSGVVTDFQRSPEQYDAIGFHEEDLADAGWEPTVSLTVPSSWSSGVYAARFDTPASIDYVPFIVRPRDETPSGIAVLLPTLTYLAYANRRFDERVREMLADFGRGADVALSPHEAYVAEHPELGLSLYDRHAGGELCAYSSRLRPIIELRPDYYHWITGTPRHFSADLHLLGWLESRGYRYDVITDEDLHADGIALVRRYDVLVTGSHPEYVTAPMRDALEAYVAEGGRLMYLGGNGFYWVASLDRERPSVMEVRRGHAGTGEGYSAPGEGHHSSTGEPGGLWRLRGRPPQTLVGVGFTGQGWVDAAGYRRCPDSDDPKASFIFEGVSRDGPIGAFGPLGGAAGDEIDRADAALGTPGHALVVASSQGLHSDGYQGAIEDSSCLTPRSGGTTNGNVRADMVLAEMPRGGAVFSVGSIAWSLSLAHDGGDNEVARITANVLDHFLTRRLAATG